MRAIQVSSVHFGRTSIHKPFERGGERTLMCESTSDMETTAVMEPSVVTSPLGRSIESTTVPYSTPCCRTHGRPAPIASVDVTVHSMVSHTQMVPLTYLKLLGSLLPQQSKHRSRLVFPHRDPSTCITEDRSRLRRYILWRSLSLQLRHD